MVVFHSYVCSEGIHPAIHHQGQILGKTLAWWTGRGTVELLVGCTMGQPHIVKKGSNSLLGAANRWSCPWKPSQLSIYLSVYLSICLYIYLSVYLSVCLSIYNDQSISMHHKPLDSLVVDQHLQNASAPKGHWFPHSTTDGSRGAHCSLRKTAWYGTSCRPSRLSKTWPGNWRWKEKPSCCFVNLYNHIAIYIYICIEPYVCVYIHICMYVCMHACMCVYIYIYIRIYIYNPI